MNQRDTTDGPVDIDALIVGGGVQGLTLLHELTGRGYATAIVTNAPLGSGQTLHAHGFLNSGYVSPDPALRRSVEEDWLGFLAEHGVETYGEDRFFGIVPPELSELLSDAWTTCGYPFEKVAPETLPPGFRQGLPADVPLDVVKIEEYCVPKRGMVTALSDGVTDQVIRGDVSAVRFEPADDDGGVAVSAVDVETHATGRTVTLRPKFLIAAAGTGTGPFVESIVGGQSFGEAAGDDATRIRESISRQLDVITVERAHMICVRGPQDVLPGANVLLATQGLSVVSADVDEAHDRVSGDHRTWYVTPASPVPEPVDHPPNSHLTDPDPVSVARGIEVLLDAFPPFREHVDELDFGVYAGYKQNIGDSRTDRLCEPVEGTANLPVALPSVIGGAWLNARAAARIVEGAVDPGEADPIPCAGEGVRVGDVVERSDGFEWLSWEAFSEAFPGVDA